MAGMKDAAAIRKIMEEYLPGANAQEVFKRLYKEVGEASEDEVVKSGLFALQEALAPVPKPPKKMKFILKAIIAFHALIIVFNFIAIFVLPFLAPWYVSLPLITLVINLMFSPIACPLTKLESTIRRGMGLPEVRFFMKHYFIDPARKWWKARKKGI